MIEVLIEKEDVNKKGGSVEIGRGGDSFAMAIHLWDISRGNEASKTTNLYKSSLETAEH